MCRAVSDQPRGREKTGAALAGLEEKPEARDSANQAGRLRVSLRDVRARYFLEQLSSGQPTLVIRREMGLGAARKRDSIEAGTR